MKKKVNVYLIISLMIQTMIMIAAYLFEYGLLVLGWVIGVLGIVVPLVLSRKKEEEK